MTSNIEVLSFHRSQENYNGHLNINIFNLEFTGSRPSFLLPATLLNVMDGFS